MKENSASVSTAIPIDPDQLLTIDQAAAKFKNRGDGFTENKKSLPNFAALLQPSVCYSIGLTSLSGLNPVRILAVLYERSYRAPNFS